MPVTLLDANTPRILLYVDLNQLLIKIIDIINCVFNLILSSFPEYINQNESLMSSMTNPKYQHPGPPRTIPHSSSALDETEEEYLNCFKSPAAAAAAPPEYLNTSHTQLLSRQPFFSVQGFNPQNSMNNPDYQQDFCPLELKTHTNGHLPAAENAEYMGLEVH